MKTPIKQDFKIKLLNKAEFEKAWKSLHTLGYHFKGEKPYGAPYVYTYSDGQIGVDYLDVEGADHSSPESAAGYFTNHKNPELSLDELIKMAKVYEQEKYECEIKILKHERPLFEDNYIRLGGSLQYIKWEECDDGAGTYQVDWLKLPKEELHKGTLEEEVTARAKLVTNCLFSWVECAKSKVIPEGYYLMPLQPDEEMLKNAVLEFKDLGIEDIEDRIVFSHQAMIEVRQRNKQ